MVAAINGIAIFFWLGNCYAVKSIRKADKIFCYLPEVNLGLLPGGGGTQKASRLVGPGETLKMMLSLVMCLQPKTSFKIVDKKYLIVVEDAMAFIKEVSESVENHPKVRDKKKNDRGKRR